MGFGLMLWVWLPAHAGCVTSGEFLSPPSLSVFTDVAGACLLEPAPLGLGPVCSVRGETMGLVGSCQEPRAWGFLIGHFRTGKGVLSDLYFTHPIRYVYIYFPGGI